jgi:hypothetical protein
MSRAITEQESSRNAGGAEWENCASWHDTGPLNEVLAKGLIGLNVVIVSDLHRATIRVVDHAPVPRVFLISCVKSIALDLGHPWNLSFTIVNGRSGVFHKRSCIPG